MLDVVCRCERQSVLSDASADLVIDVEDFGVVLLRVFVDDADAGAGGEVVELVEGDFFPVFGELVGGVGTAVEPC